MEIRYYKVAGHTFGVSDEAETFALMDNQSVYEFVWWEDSAAWLWKQAQEQGDFTIDSLAGKLCEEYDVTVDESKNDVTEILKEWQDIGVLEDS